MRNNKRRKSKRWLSGQLPMSHAQLKAHRLYEKAMAAAEAKALAERLLQEKEYRIAQWIEARALEMRLEPTTSEKALSYAMTLAHIPFDSQPVILRCIPDFKIRGTKLLVEVDGLYHQNPAQRKLDDARDSIFEAEGYVILHFTNDRVHYQIDWCIEIIMENLNALLAKEVTSPCIIERGAEPNKGLSYCSRFLLQFHAVFSTICTSGRRRSSHGSKTRSTLVVARG